ncbi:PqqD family peptide modification chaperone [Phreatobacter stygius]|uniref:PqqD family peptide modification chaperone n=2 Tax=Phreatobacter stygius TaxID=1940610 RepID=A0A4D7BD13_9HYPH|nr:PqqD family peptide modification chaperone [Phreatobacter stygius]
MADAVAAFGDEHHDAACLHAAAVQIGARLILFPAATGEGKTLLAARLAAMGARIFADDAVLIAGPDDQAMAFGTAPRLRKSARYAPTAPFAAFLAHYAGPEDRQFLYLALPPDLLASHGECLGITDVVRLRRRRGETAELTRAARGDGLAALLRQDLTPRALSVAAVDRLHRVASAADAYGLAYDDVDEAAALLIREFSKPTGPEVRSARLAIRDRRPAARRHAAMARRFVRATDATRREIDGQLVLMRPGKAVFVLNETAGIVWELLDEPMPVEQLVGALIALFPAIAPRRITADLQSLLAELRQEHLIAEIDQA